MNFKEKLKKILDDQRLDKEMKIARKKIEEKEKEKIQVVKLNNTNNQEENINEIKTNKNSKKEKDNNVENKNDIDRKFKFSIERLKDAGLVAVAVTLIGVGYINFSEKEDNKIEEQILQTSSESSNSLGDVQLVNSDNVELVENDNSVENTVSTASENDDSNTISNSTSSETSSISAYFTELKLNRDNIYSEKLEAYQQIIDSSAISSEQKAIAIQEIESITETQNSISIAEELIKLKGFENVVIYVNDNAVTVIVRSANLTSDQVAQIQNIVTRQLNVDVSNISISNK